MKKVINADKPINGVVAEDIYAEFKKVFDECNAMYDDLYDFCEYVTEDKEYSRWEFSLDFGSDIENTTNDCCNNAIQMKANMGNLIKELSSVMSYLQENKNAPV